MPDPILLDPRNQVLAIKNQTGPDFEVDGWGVRVGNAVHRNTQGSEKVLCDIRMRVNEQTLFVEFIIPDPLAHGGELPFFTIEVSDSRIMFSRNQLDSNGKVSYQEERLIRQEDHRILWQPPTQEQKISRSAVEEFMLSLIPGKT